VPFTSARNDFNRFEIRAKPNRQLVDKSAKSATCRAKTVEYSPALSSGFGMNDDDGGEEVENHD